MNKKRIAIGAGVGVVALGAALLLARRDGNSVEPKGGAPIAVPSARVLGRPTCAAHQTLVKVGPAFACRDAGTP